MIGTVEIPFGRYRALFLNNDSETLLLRGTERFTSFELYTRTSTLLEPLGLQGNPEGAGSIQVSKCIDTNIIICYYLGIDRG